MPQIHVPVELLIFHVCTLGVLEKHKNKIGEMQHQWLLMMGHYLDLTDQILPREINTFALLGNLPVFAEDASSNQLKKTPSDGLEEDHDIFPLWNHLLAETDASKREKMLQSNIHNMDTPEIPRYNGGTVQSNGKKLLTSHTYIRLPSASSTSGPSVNTSEVAESPESKLLPTSIGPYRLKQGVSKERVRCHVTELYTLSFRLSHILLSSLPLCLGDCHRSLVRRGWQGHSAAAGGLG